MSDRRLIAALQARGAPTAFETAFRVPKTHICDDYGVSVTADGDVVGCRVPRMSLSIHCTQPHLECASHVLPKSCNWTVSDAISNGKEERTILVTPVIEMLGESGDSYPSGAPDDPVISLRSLRAAIAAYDALDEKDSILVRVPESYFPTYSDCNEIRAWPYVTQECARFLRLHFAHYRTNAPSVERVDSGGGMWIHRILFGIEIPSTESLIDGLPLRTIGELFHIPSTVLDGEYILICPFLEMGLDCAMTVPLLYSKS
jgi:hypothetical protein